MAAAKDWRIHLRARDLRRPRFFLGVAKRRSQIKLYRLLGREVEVAVTDRVRLKVPARDALVHLLEEADFEAGDRDFVARVLRPGDTVIDLGAHVGLYALIAAHAVAPAGRVVACEPNPATYATLVRNVARNGLDAIVECRQVAVSDEEGTANLHVPDVEHAAWSSLGSPAAGTTSTVAVSAATLDAIAGEQAQFLVKIDVEGWETHVLQGGRSLLARADAPHLLVEFSDAISANTGQDTRVLRAMLEELGYQLLRYQLGGHALVADRADDGYGVVNVVASKRPDELRLRLDG